MKIYDLLFFSVLNNEEVFKTARLWERYEKPFRKRGRLCYEKYEVDYLVLLWRFFVFRAHEIYNNEMERKIKFLMRKNRVNPWPWN